MAIETFGQTDEPTGVSDSPGEVYRRVQGSAEFQDLRGDYRGLAFPTTAAFLAWYLLFIVLSTAVPELMRAKVYGQMTVALLLGLAQFVSTFVICVMVARRAATHRDGKALELRWRTQEELR